MKEMKNRERERRMMNIQGRGKIVKRDQKVYSD